MNEMIGRTCIITGSNSGIGKETTLGLARTGANIVMAVRNRERGERAKAEIIEKSGNRSVDLMLCDVSSMSSIRNFAKEFGAKYEKLNVLMNNAGAVFSKRDITDEGFERTLAVNYLGPFLLAHELLDRLKTGAPSRIINLSSGLHKSGRVVLDDLNSQKNYDGMKVYSNAKLMVLMFTYELARRLEGTGVTVNAAMPGFAATNLGSNSGSLRSSIMFKLVRPMQITAEKGAGTSVYLASSDEVEGVTGKCFKKKLETVTAPMSYDAQMQRQLWKKTVELLCLKSD